MMVEMMMEMMVGWNQASLDADNIVINDDCNGLIALAMKAIKNQVILDQLKSGISRRRVGLLSKGRLSKNNQNIERRSFF